MVSLNLAYFYYFSTSQRIKVVVQIKANVHFIENILKICVVCLFYFITVVYSVYSCVSVSKIWLQLYVTISNVQQNNANNKFMLNSSK